MALDFHDVEQGSEAWIDLRLGKATASNFACFMANDGKAFGEPAKRYALQLALERLTGSRGTNGFSNDHTERGHEQEPIARMLYEEEMFCRISNGGFFCCDDYGDSPDGLVGNAGGIEIKSVIAPVHYANLQRGAYDPAYKWQLAGHLDCTGRDWFDFVSYCADFPRGQQLFVHRVHRDDLAGEIAALQRRRDEFLSLVLAIKQSIELKAA